MSAALFIALAGLTAVVLLTAPSRPGSAETGAFGGAAGDRAWRSDPAWAEGRTEWARYEAQRVIDGEVRRYEAAILTEKRYVDPNTAVTASDPRARGAIEVFSHTICETIPADNAEYCFLTTSFLRADGLQPYKLVASSLAPEGASYRQFVVERGERVLARQFCAFPGTGESAEEYAVPQEFAFFNALSLSLRDFPFGAVFIRAPELNFVPEQRDNRHSTLTTLHGVISYIGEETLDLPYGRVRAHHVQIDHDEMGGTEVSHFWFAAEEPLRNVMVQYEGPFGVKFSLKEYGWRPDSGAAAHDPE